MCSLTSSTLSSILLDSMRRALMKGVLTDELWPFFQRAEPPGLLDDVLTALSRGYERASQHAHQLLPGPDAHDVLGHLRRGEINASLRLVARDHSIYASANLNKNGGSYHTLIAFNGVMLTAATVHKRGELVRPAVHRANLARNSQMALLPEFEEPEPPDGAYVYAVLLHGPDPLNPAVPAFVDLAFPDLRFSSYLLRVDLRERYNVLLQVAEPAPVEEVPEVAVALLDAGSE
jgi:hypothetical protein